MQLYKFSHTIKASMIEQRVDFTDLLAQIDILDELLDADDERQQQTQVPAAGYAGDVDKDLRDILGDEFMDSFGPHAQDDCDAPQDERVHLLKNLMPRHLKDSPAAVILTILRSLNLRN